MEIFADRYSTDINRCLVHGGMNDMVWLLRPSSREPVTDRTEARHQNLDLQTCTRSRTKCLMILAVIASLQEDHHCHHYQQYHHYHHYQQYHHYHHYQQYHHYNRYHHYHNYHHSRYNTIIQIRVITRPLN